MTKIQALIVIQLVTREQGKDYGLRTMKECYEAMYAFTVAARPDLSEGALAARACASTINMLLAQ